MSAMNEPFADLDPRFALTEFLIAADNYARLQLWFNFSEDGAKMLAERGGKPRSDEPRRLRWEEDTRGRVIHIGDCDDRNVSVCFVWAKLDGHLVAFYEHISQVADHKLIDDWLNKYCHPTYDRGRPARIDAMNFHICYSAIVHGKLGQPLERR